MENRDLLSERDPTGNPLLAMAEIIRVGVAAEEGGQSREGLGHGAGEEGRAPRERRWLFCLSYRRKVQFN